MTRPLGDLRVAHVMAGAPRGGAELFFERLAAAQHRAGLAVLPVIRREPARAERLRVAGLDPVQLRFGGPLDPFTRPRLRSVLRRARPGVVVGWMNRATAACPRGDWVLCGRLGGFYDLRHYRHCDHLIGNTAGIVSWLREQGWPDHRTHHLPNFAAEMAGAVPQRPAAIPPGAPFLLALGRLHRNKAFDSLLRALAAVPDAHLFIAGEGPERPALEALRDELGLAGRCHLPGWSGDPAPLLAACDVLVCPSRHEPLGNVVIEAFSAARPVVAARSRGPVELIRPGSDGLLVPVDDPPALAAALRELLADPARAARLAAAGRARYEAEFAAVPVLARWNRFLSTVERA